MPLCKCRYCQTSINPKDAHLHMFGKQKAFFCNEEHCNLFIFKKEEDKRKKEEELEAARQKKREEIEAERKKKQKELELTKQKKLRELEELEAAKAKKKEEMAAAKKQKQEEHDLAVKKYKEDKDKAYYLICEIVGRKEIINTVLWKEWKEWNKVASNETIGMYLDENKNYLCSAVSKIDNNEFLRIRYLSAMLKNNLGDYNNKPVEKRIVVQQFPEEIEPEVDTRDDVGLRINKKKKNVRRKGFAEMED